MRLELECWSGVCVKCLKIERRGTRHEVQGIRSVSIAVLIVVYSI